MRLLAAAASVPTPDFHEYTTFVSESFTSAQLLGDQQILEALNILRHPCQPSHVGVSAHSTFAELCISGTTQLAPSVPQNHHVMLIKMQSYLFLRCCLLSIIDLKGGVEQFSGALGGSNDFSSPSANDIQLLRQRIEQQQATPLITNLVVAMVIGAADDDLIFPLHKNKHLDSFPNVHSWVTCFGVDSATFFDALCRHIALLLCKDSHNLESNFLVQALVEALFTCLASAVSDEDIFIKLLPFLLILF